MNTYIVLDTIMGLVSLGLRYDQIYTEIKAKRQAGATDQEISDLLDGMRAQAIAKAQAAIDAAR